MHNLNTRLVDVRLKLELSAVNDDTYSIFEEEFNKLNINTGLPIEKMINRYKNKSDSNNAQVFEILLEIYKKIDKIEKILEDEKIEYIKLENNNYTKSIGHGFLILIENELKIDTSYYVRLFTPSFRSKAISFFGVAIQDNILKITQMSERDIKEFDNFVVNIERESLRVRKIKREIKSEK